MAICMRSFVYHFRRGRYVIPVQLAREYGLKVQHHNSALALQSWSETLNHGLKSIHSICRCIKVTLRSNQKL
jgi:hypothetical protein